MCEICGDPADSGVKCLKLCKKCWELLKEAE